MIKELEQLSREELELLLSFQTELDNLLDRGMAEGEHINLQLKGALTLLCEKLRIYEGHVSLPSFNFTGVIFYDHFRDVSIVITNHLCKKDSLIKLHNLLSEEDLIKISQAEMEENEWKPLISVMKDMGNFTGKKMMLHRLEVFDRFLGYMFMEIAAPTLFHRTILSHFTAKIDTAIYSYNSMVYERLKSDGLTHIDNILDTELTLNEKYYEILKLVATTIRANSGFLIIPSDGVFKIAARYVREGEKEPLSDEDLLGVVEQTVKRAENNVFVRLEEINISKGELLSIVLKPGERNIEGILILHHRDFLEEHRGMAQAFSNLIDSSLFVDRLYGLIFKNFIDTLGEIIDTFDTYTSGHSDRVSRYSIALGKAMGLTEVEMTKLKIASILHDIGKVGIDPHIIRKKGALTIDERKQIENHAKFSGTILKGVFPFELSDIYNLAMSHHEKEDGSGYPNRIPGGEIPLLSKIIAVADVFDALTSDRPYHRGRTRDKAYEILKEDALRGKLSSQVVEKFAGEEVWNDIREAFFSLKVISACEWYLKEMLPDITLLETNAHIADKCREDLGTVKDRYLEGAEINIEILEDTLLYPSDKDRLIQRETQRSQDEYLSLIEKMKARYEKDMESIKEKIGDEKRFRREFWQPDVLSEIRILYLGINEKGLDLLKPISDFMDAAEKLPDVPPETPIIRFLEMKLNESEKKKGLNENYLSSLVELKNFAVKIPLSP